MDVDALNRAFVQQLNASIDAEWTGDWRPKPCLTAAPLRADLGAAAAPPSVGAARHRHVTPPFTVRFAVGGRCELRHLWPRVSEVADDVLTRSFAHLDLCGCDHAAVQLAMEAAA